MQDNISIKDFPPDTIKSPISSYFIETYANVDTKSGGEWLKTVDDDTLSFLSQSFERLRYEDSETNEEFEGFSPESSDLMATGVLIGCWELKQRSISNQLFNKLMSSFNVSLDFESMRRKNLIYIEGDGKFTSDDTMVKNTELGDTLAETFKDKDTKE